jgi:hypothetical protein
MASLSIVIDTAKWEKELSAIQRKQLPFAIALAINTTMGQAQKAAQASLKGNFTIDPKRLQWMQRLIRFPKKGGWRATKKNLAAKMDLGLGERPYYSASRSWVLGRHEEGGMSRQPNPDEPFYIPTSVMLPSAGVEPKPRAWYPRNLRLYARRTPSKTLAPKTHATKTGKLQRKGKHRTFVIEPGSVSNIKQAGIYQRFGKGKDSSVRKLWHFSRTVHRKPRLRLQQITQKVHARRFDENFDRALAHALATARG